MKSCIDWRSQRAIDRGRTFNMTGQSGLMNEFDLNNKDVSDAGSSFTDPGLFCKRNKKRTAYRLSLFDFSTNEIRTKHWHQHFLF